MGYGTDPSGHQAAWIASLGTPSQPPLADAGPDQMVQCAGELTEVALDGSLSFDPDGDPLQYEWSVATGSGAAIADLTAATTSGTFPVGPTLVTLTVTDGAGGVDVADVLVTVFDSLPPVVVCTTDRAALWPPNHEMAPVELSVVASDLCDDPAGLMVNCLITSNELDDATGDGSSIGDTDGADGFTDPVVVTLTYNPLSLSYDATIALRAERDGVNASRVYSIVCDVLDTAGNLATSSCVVLVPHDRRKN